MPRPPLTLEGKAMVPEPALEPAMSRRWLKIILAVSSALAFGLIAGSLADANQAVADVLRGKPRNTGLA